MRLMPDEDGLKAVFDHVRNVVTATLIITAGIYAMGNPLDTRFALLPALPGVGVALIGIVLLLLNFADGLRRLYRMRFHVLLQMLMVFGYATFSWRLVQIMLAFQRQ